MKAKKGLMIWLVAGLVVLALGLAGCAAKNGAPAKKAGPAAFPCVAKGKLTQTIAPEAKLEKMCCFFKKWKGEKVLHFKVLLKNVSKEPQRYRVNIFLDNGKAVGGLIPRKTKKGLVKPGATAGFTYPIKGMTTKAKAVTLFVKTMSK